MNRVSVSVIIPCYNCGNTIVRALDSVANQTMLPSEVILVDDNEDKLQTKYLFELINKYQKLNIKLVSHIKNFGAPAARNTGWNLSKSKYIAFLDSDDSWHTQKLELQYNFMKNHLDITFTGHNIEILEDNILSDKNEFKDIFLQECTKFEILIRNIFPTPTLMFKRDIPYRFDEGMRYVDDHLLLMTIIFDNNKAIKIKNKLAYVFKPMFGASGLSSNMYQMEKHELIAYTKIIKANKIGLLTYILIITFSLLKYLRRLLVNLFKIKRKKGNNK